MPLARYRRSASAALLLALAFSAAPLGAQLVTTVADSGAGSLREAIEAANADAVPSAITFAPGLAGQAIQLLSALPALTEADTSIDGDLGADCDPDIGLDGGGAIATALSAQAAGTLIRGLAIYNFTGTAVDLNGDSALECSSVGTNLALANDVGNQGTGVVARGGDNRIGPGNAIAFNGGHGVQVEDLFANAYPEFTALSADYTGVFPVIDFSDDCASFHSSDDVLPLDGGGQPFTENFGMRLTGTITVGSAGSYTFSLPNLDDLARLTVGGNELIDWQGGGTPPPADLVLGAGGHSIRLEFLEGGGAARLDLDISGPASPTLATDGNSGGCPGAQPGLCGELFQLRTPSEGNTVTANAIHDNDGLGIALNCCCGPVPNDGGDGDVGANTLLNHPLITGFAYAGTPLQYTVSGTAAANASVELFVRDNDPSGFGEGPAYLGTATALGDGSFSANVTLVPLAPELTATATDLLGNTSEFGPAFAPPAGLDTATVPVVGGSHLPGAMVEIPLYIRDRSSTPLGNDRPSGSEIQGWRFQMQVAPVAAVGSLSYARAGIVAPATAGSEGTFYSAGTGIFSAGYNDPLAFTVDAGAPGDQVGKLTLVLAAAAPAGALTFTWSAAETELRNEADAFGAPPSENPETQGLGTLELVSGSVMVASNAASGLLATTQSTSAIFLSWSDPGQNETGFRLERSLDGSSYDPVVTLGPDATTHLDAGLTPATLYHYRLVTLIAAGDSQTSNLATAATFPSAAAKVCVERVSLDRRWARFPSAVWNGSDWAVAWQAREDGLQDDIYFQRFNSTTLAPIGASVQITSSATLSQIPGLAWNGSRYGLLWGESLAGEAGALYSSLRFALLDAAGAKLREDVPILQQPSLLGGTSRVLTELAWDGTHWGLFTREAPVLPLNDVFYRRIDADGDLVLGPVAITNTAGHFETEVAAAFHAAAGLYGVAWMRVVDASHEVYFQRVEETTGAAVGAPALLGSFTSWGGSGGLSVAPDGTGWAVSWSEDAVDDSELVVYMRRVDGSGAALGAGAERLSDDLVDPDDPPVDFLPWVAGKPGGGFAVFTNSFLADGSSEIARLQADAAGVRSGSRALMSGLDARHSSTPRVAGDGSRFLLAFQENGGPGTMEIGGVLVDASGANPPGSVVPFTAGHSPGNTRGVLPPGAGAVAPLLSGFAALWTDAVSGTNRIYARTYDAAGNLITAATPLTTSGVRGTPALAAVGDAFAVVWKEGSNLRFGRYDASAAPLLGEVLVSTTAGGSPQVAISWNGESYGLLWQEAGSLTFQMVAPNGTPLGAKLAVLGSIAGPNPHLLWVGTGWAVVWMRPDGNLHYGRLDPDGSVAVAATPLTAIFTPLGVVNEFSAHWSGSFLGVAWAEIRGNDPPGRDLYFTIVNLDGSKAFPDITAVSGGLNDASPRLYFAGGRFHLVHLQVGVFGLREIEIETDGTLVPGERFWANRGAAAAVAWNGATLGILWPQLSDLYFETSACAADATPPPCPVLNAAFQANAVALSWPAVNDVDSGIWRYHVYRDGAHLAELPSTSLAHVDRGYRVGASHSYEVRAMNGGFQESEGCSTDSVLAGNQDSAALGAAGPAFPGAAVEIPVFARDVNTTPLGVDRPAGERIQRLRFQIAGTPAASIANAVVQRAGLTAALTPLSENSGFATGTVTYTAVFAESSNAIPFTLDAAAPGDQVAKVVVTLAPNAPAGAVELSLVAAQTELSNESDTIDETAANGSLTLSGGTVTVASDAVIGLVATAQSSSQVLLTWGDPELIETGFRLERSLDGSSYSPVISLGADATSHLDTGLSAATLYHYRVITLIGASVDSQSSNVATAMTYPAAAAHVCVERVSADRGWARNPSAAYRGPEWAVAWQGRDDGDQDDIFFQRLDGTSLAPLGAPVNVSATDMVSGGPTLVWNGSHYGLVWTEGMRAEPGVNTSTTMFSLLNPDGTTARGGVRLTSGPADILLLGNVGGQTALAWDGTHWGLFLPTVNDAGLSPLDDIVYRRLEEDGDLAVGPVAVTATPGHFELDLAVAWAAPVSKHGLAWVRFVNGSSEIYFQRVEETTGAPVGSPVLLATGAIGASLAGLSIVWDGNGWAVAWSQFDSALGEGPLYLRRVDAAGNPAGPAQRLSRAFDPDDPPDDGVPVVLTKPGGGYAIFTGSIAESTNFGLEIGRFEATAAGLADGALELMTSVDDATSYLPRVASDGSRFLVVLHDSGAGTLEVAGLLVDADGASPPGLPVQLTAGHTLGNSFAVRPPGTPAVAPLGAGFVVVWTDVATTTASELRGRIYDGAGAAVADLDPLSANGVNGAFGLVGVGDNFAVAWRQGNTVRFGRFGPSGSPLGSETLVTTTAAGGGARTVVAWSGDSYGVLWRQNDGLHFRRLAPDGTPIGSEVVLFQSFSQQVQIEWVGLGWALAFQQPDGNLAYALLDVTGAIVVAPTPLTAISPQGGIRGFDLHWTGQYLGVAWAESKGFDIPDTDLYFTVVDRASGTKAFPEVLAFGTGWSEGNPILFFADGRFHLAFQGGNGPGIGEIEIETNGTLLPGTRFLTSRGGGFALAWNGVTAGVAWPGDGLRDLYFETTACLNDITSPPCPALSAAMQGGKVALGWPSVTDPESGIWRYNLYRDGAMLAELFPATVSASDGGFTLGQIHQYELRAQNGAFQESESCPLVPFLAHSGLFHTLPPCRVFDSRFAPDQPALAHGVVRAIPFPGECGVPATARAVVVNITAVVPGGTGRLTVYPGDIAAPDTSVVSFTGGQTRASAAVIGLAADGTGVLKILPEVNGGGSVDVIVDVSGYFE